MNETVTITTKRFSDIQCVDDATKLKKDRYNLAYKQVLALVEGEDDCIANMSNIAALLHSTFGFWWTGFYIVKGDELVLGPFQGPVACSSLSRSEIVVPVFRDGKVVAVLDIDSINLNEFDEIDRESLEKITGLIHIDYQANADNKKNLGELVYNH